MSFRKLNFTFLSFFIFAIACTSLEQKQVLQRSPSSESIVAIFGDLHEEFEIKPLLFQRIRSAGATHIIGMGDFILWKGIPALHLALHDLTEKTNVPKSNVFLLPGNWEQTLNDPSQVNAVLSSYGHLVTPKYDQTGSISINGHRVRAGHFPQHSLPEILMPPPNFVRSISGQITIVETMARDNFPSSKDFELEIFSHTHVGGIYFDPRSGVWAVNPGVLEGQRKRSNEPKAFALWYVESGTILFVSVENGEILRKVETRSSTELCAQKPCALRDH